MNRPVRMAGTFAVLLAGALLPATRAWADPWIPPAGSGVMKPMVRFFGSDRAFPASSFTARTVKASKETVIQPRITGVFGLGSDLSLEYDFRGASVRTSRIKNHRDVVNSSTGPQDQEIGLNYGLTQAPDFAQSIAFNLVAPTGRVQPSPSLGTGRWSVEPDYQAGLRSGRFSATLILGPRVFLDGKATQLRSTVDLAVHALSRLTVFSEAFFVRTIQMAHTLTPSASGELYNLLRAKIGLTYRLTPRYRPFFAYEDDIAGRGIHAGQRITIGMAIHF